MLEQLPGLRTLADGEVKDRQFVRVGGMFTELKRITTRKGETMCFATLEDFTDSLEITVFPRVFYDHVNLLAVDTAVVVQGHVDITDDGVKLLADNLWPLASYQLTYYIKIPESKESQETRDALRELFQAYHGDRVVYLQMGGRWQKTGANYWLREGDDVRAAFEQLLGSDTVHLR